MTQNGKTNPQPSILEQILTEIQKPFANGKKRISIFDLDSTLFDVSPRLQQILKDFAEHPNHIKKFPELVSLVAKAKPHRLDWGIKQSLERVGLENAPREFQETIRDFWRTHFFSDDYLYHDVPYAGAVEFVNTLHRAHVEIIYLTGRDQLRMGKGSPEVLQKWNFPLNSKNAKLVLKPDRTMNDALFKKEWLTSLNKSEYSNIWFFENEPLNIIEVDQHIPEIDIIFFDSTHSGQADVPTHLPRIKDFSILKEV